MSLQLRAPGQTRDQSRTESCGSSDTEDRGELRATHSVQGEAVSGPQHAGGRAHEAGKKEPLLLPDSPG
eukprot:2065749-Pyramimonas_sp.AAC.1